MGSSPGTDYMPREEFQQRALEAKARGDGTIKPGKLLTLHVTWSPDFDVFAANTAFAIRHEVVYRSDGGTFARGFVRANGDLQHVFEFYRDPSHRFGPTVEVRAKLYRRKAAGPAMRWVQAIQFRIPSIDFTPDEVDPVHARDDVMHDLEKIVPSTFSTRHRTSSTGRSGSAPTAAAAIGSSASGIG